MGSQQSAHHRVPPYPGMQGAQGAGRAQVLHSGEEVDAGWLGVGLLEALWPAGVRVGV